MAATPSTTPERKHPPKPPPPTFNVLLALEGQRITFIFCKQGHRSVDYVVTIVSETKEILKKHGRCFICLKRSHIVKDCNSKWGCSNCAQRHHPSLCMANDTLTIDNSLAGVPRKWTASVDSKTSILLQTCIALASNPASVQPQEKYPVRIILDSGSQRTNITTQLKETLGSRERLCIKASGSDYNNLKTVDVVILYRRVLIMTSLCITMMYL